MADYTAILNLIVKVLDFVQLGGDCRNQVIWSASQ